MLSICLNNFFIYDPNLPQTESKEEKEKANIPII